MHKKHKDKKIDEEIKKSLIYSIFDGAFFFVMLGMAEQYFQAYAVYLNASVLQISLIFSLPIFLGSLFQLMSHYFLQKIGSRKKLILYASLIRTIIFIPIIFIGIFGSYKIWALIVLISLYFSLNFIEIPVWTEWMGELVNEKKRGQYFGKRNKIANLMMLISLVIAGLILRYFENKNKFIGFAIIFSIAMISSLLSMYFINKKYDVKLKEKVETISFKKFVKDLPRTNFGRFTIYNFLIYFSVFLSAPFFTPYMLRVLNFNYLEFMLSIAFVSFFKYISTPVWGNLGDHYGHKKTLILSGLLLIFAPALWILSNKWKFMAYVAESMSGISWGGFEISTLNFSFDVVKPELRARLISFLSFFRGLGIILGGIVGGIIMSHLKFLQIPELGIFLISSLSRLFIASPLLLMLKEVRKVKQISYKRLLYEMTSAFPRGIQEFSIGLRKKLKK